MTEATNELEEHDWEERPFRHLKGRRVKAVWASSDASVLRFETDGGDVVVCSEGDCCSEAWFSDFTGLDALIGEVVLGCESRSLPEPADGRCRQTEDDVLGYMFRTAKGYADLMFRCSSNGYYTGRAVEPGERDVATPVRVSGDWSA